MANRRGNLSESKKAKKVLSQYRKTRFINRKYFKTISYEEEKDVMLDAADDVIVERWEHMLRDYYEDKTEKETQREEERFAQWRREEGIAFRKLMVDLEFLLFV